MYNGIGLTTPRGSGTNGHVQRNWAFVRPGKKDNSNYRSEEDIKKLDATLNRPPNKEILDHDRKRKIEVKCIEFEEILEKQGRSPEEIKSKVDSYRQKLMGLGKSDLPKDEFGRIAVRETHQIAEAQQEKNAKLREAFNISEYFVEGSSFDSDRKTKEDLAKSLALQKELDAQRESAAAIKDKEKERDDKRRYALVRTPSQEKDNAASGGSKDDSDNEVRDHVSKSEKKKKKKRTRESSASPERKRDKKKKSKKHKKESKSKKKKSRKRKASVSDSGDSDHGSDNEKPPSSDSEYELKKQRKRNKKDKKKRDKKKRKERSSSVEKSRSRSPERVVKAARKRSEERSSRRGEKRSSQRSTSKSATRNRFDRRSSERHGKGDRRQLEERSKRDDRNSTRNISQSSTRNPFRSHSRERPTHGRSPSKSRRRNSPAKSQSREYSRERNRDKERRSRRELDDHSRERRREVSANRNARERSKRRYSRSISRDNRRDAPSRSRHANTSRTRTRSHSRSKSSKRYTRKRSPSTGLLDKLRKRTITPTVPPPKGLAASVSPTRSTSSTSKNPFNPFKIDVAPLAAPVNIKEVRHAANPFKNVAEAAKYAAIPSRTRSPSAASSVISRTEEEKLRTKRELRRRISLEKARLNERASSVLSSHSTRDERSAKPEVQNTRKRSREQKLSPRRRRHSTPRSEREFKREPSCERKRSEARERSASSTVLEAKQQQREHSRAREKSSKSARRSASRSDREVEKRKRSSRERRTSRDSRTAALRSDRETKKRDRSRERRVAPDKQSKQRSSEDRITGSASALLRKLSSPRQRRSLSHSPAAAAPASKDTASPERIKSRSPTEKRSKYLASPPLKRRLEDEPVPLRRSHSRNSSELSYSPARRNPERYRDILEGKGKEKERHLPPDTKDESTKRNTEIDGSSQDTRKMLKASEEAGGNEHENRERSGRVKERATNDNSRARAIERERNLERESQSQRGSDRSDRPRSREKRLKEHKRERDTRDASSSKRAKPLSGPVVRLQGQSEDENEIDDRTEKVVAALDEFQETRRGRELKDMEMLEQLKTDIAAKAKEKLKTIEKMATSGGNINSEPLVAALTDSTLVDTIVSKVSTATVAAAESAARRSSSRSRRSRSRSRPRRDGGGGGGGSGGGGGTGRRHSNSRSRSSHYSSSSSRSHSRTRSRSHRSSRSRSHSHSSQSSCSTRSSSRSSSSSGSSGSSRTGSRSPSIPRRRGSPSFLDRRRITSARKRPIPYHRKTSSDASSFCSSCYSRESSPHSPSRSPARSSHSPSAAF